MDVLVKEIDGVETIWYSEDYVKTLVENAELKGFSEGVRVELHAVTPINEEGLIDLSKHINDKITTERLNSYIKNKEWLK